MCVEHHHTIIFCRVIEGNVGLCREPKTGSLATCIVVVTRSLASCVIWCKALFSLGLCFPFEKLQEWPCCEIFNSLPCIVIEPVHEYMAALWWKCYLMV